MRVALVVPVALPRTPRGCSGGWGGAWAGPAVARTGRLRGRTSYTGATCRCCRQEVSVTVISTSVAEKCRYPGPRRFATSTFPNMPRLRAWLHFGPFHGFVGRSGDYLCRLPTRVFVPAFFLLDEQRHE